VDNQETTKQDINKLIEFRQAIYAHALLARRDALFDLMDALICEGPVSSFAMLSQSSRFQRKWPSLYAAVEDGELDSQWLRNYLAWQVPQQGMCVFPIDGSPRPRSRVLDDRQFVYQASSDVNGVRLPLAIPIHCWSGAPNRIPVGLCQWMYGEYRAPKPLRKSDQSKSKPWHKPAWPVWKRWTLWLPMASTEMPVFCAR